mgnify:CR=1 FL=1|jgi:hypothetical protein
MRASNEIQIFDDMPIPHRAERRTYPFSELDVGQCFVVDCENRKHERSVRSSATRWNRNEELNRRFVVRRLPDTEFTVGVWRIS